MSSMTLTPEQKARATIDEYLLFVDHKTLGVLESWRVHPDSLVDSLCLSDKSLETDNLLNPEIITIAIVGDPEAALEHVEC